MQVFMFSAFPCLLFCGSPSMEYMALICYISQFYLIICFSFALSASNVYLYYLFVPDSMAQDKFQFQILWHMWHDFFQSLLSHDFMACCA